MQNGWMEQLVIMCMGTVLSCNNMLHLLAGRSHSFSDNDRAAPSGVVCEGRAERLCTQSHGRAGATQSHHNEPP